MSLFHVSFHGDKGQRKVGGLGHFRSLGRVAWMLISSPSVMAESCQGHLVKCWVSFPSCGECMSRNWGLSHPLKLVGFFFFNIHFLVLRFPVLGLHLGELQTHPPEDLGNRLVLKKRSSCFVKLLQWATLSFFFLFFLMRNLRHRKMKYSAWGVIVGKQQRHRAKCRTPKPTLFSRKCCYISFLLLNPCGAWRETHFLWNNVFLYFIYLSIIPAFLQMGNI